LTAVNIAIRAFGFQLIIKTFATYLTPLAWLNRYAAAKIFLSPYVYISTVAHDVILLQKLLSVVVTHVSDCFAFVTQNVTHCCAQAGCRTKSFFIL